MDDSTVWSPRSPRHYTSRVRSTSCITCRFLSNRSIHCQSPAKSAKRNSVRMDKPAVRILRLMRHARILLTHRQDRTQRSPEIQPNTLTSRICRPRMKNATIQCSQPARSVQRRHESQQFQKNKKKRWRYSRPIDLHPTPRTIYIKLDSTRQVQIPPRNNTTALAAPKRYHVRQRPHVHPDAARAIPPAQDAHA